ncbi:uncharacterized protein LOC131630745 [Vicia villosa]|uniref:uncharacterized protein LOC131630745 n=1 Tax=Vicia villosa TaxID=3911 RepID=UPI00273ADF8D|nr:uncharacterized protein LOC131630745 [Vicia villosa]
MLGNYEEYFQMRVDATCKIGLSPLQKCTFAICMLAYRSSADIVDEYVRIGESTSIECLERFVRGVNEVFGAEYLRRPNNNDVEHLLQMGESRGFPGMLGSIDCSNNDIDVLNQSNVFNDILEGRAASVQYTINGSPYNMGYYLADGIYPEWATFVKTISMPQGVKRKLFAQHQESAGKDVERAFGVLQSSFAIIRGPTRAWYMKPSSIPYMLASYCTT